MLILFDHVTPKGIARSLSGHIVTKAKERRWDTLTNGDLLAAAELAGFDVLVTADKNMRYQQNLAGRRIAVVVLSTRQWPVVKLHLEKRTGCGAHPPDQSSNASRRTPLCANSWKIAAAVNVAATSKQWLRGATQVDADNPAVR